MSSSSNDAERMRRKIRRRLHGSSDDGSVNSTEADAPFSPVQAHATVSFAPNVPVDQRYSALTAPARILRDCTTVERFPELLTVADILCTSIASIVAAINQKYIIYGHVVAMLLFDTIFAVDKKMSETREELYDKAQATEDDVQEIIRLANRLLELLDLLDNTAKSLQEKEAPQKPLPELPDESLTEAQADGAQTLQISASESVTDLATPDTLPDAPCTVPHTPDTVPDSAMTSLDSCDTPASTTTEHRAQAKKRVRLFGRLLPFNKSSATLQESTTTLVAPSEPATPTPTAPDEPRIAFRQSRLIDNRHPDILSATVDMPIPQNIAVRLDSKGDIQSASLAAIVMILTSDQVVAFDNLLETFFLSWRFFSRADQLMDVLEARWHEPPPNDLDALQRRVWTRHMLQVRNSLANIVYVWLTLYWRHEEDRGVRDRIEDLIMCYQPAGLLKPTERAAYDALKLAIQRGESGAIARRLQRAQERADERPKLEAPQSDFNLVLEADEGYRIFCSSFLPPGGAYFLATQLALLCQRLFSQIDPEEAVGYWVMEQGHVYAIQEWEERFLFCVAYAIVMTTDPAKRIKLVEMWIEVAAISVEFRNFSAAYAIRGALVYSPVDRLWKTTLQLGVKSKEQFRELETLFSGSNNYAAYRRLLGASELPTIPIVAVLKKDAISANQLCGKALSAGELGDNGEKLLNIGGFRMLNRVVHGLEVGFASYSFVEAHPIQCFLYEDMCRGGPPNLVEALEPKIDAESKRIEPPAPRELGVQKGKTWLQTIKGPIDGKFTLHDLPASTVTTKKGKTLGALLPFKPTGK
ncbi:Cell division control protein Cdc25 [Mycena kentingensis (nom. inval.)]|nr:Cell division control protein Cdc25 [Mycena kentingensis (nom. inval.)]